MRRFLSALVVTLAVSAPPALLPGASRADQTDRRLPALFERLKEPIAEEEAKAVEQRIWQIWTKAADDDTDALMLRGLQAMSEDETTQALAVFDEVVKRKPDFAEGWNKRATAYFILGDFDASVADIERTLRLEPHHFGALSGLGQIYLALGRKEAALKAFEAALAIDPHLGGVKAAIQELKRALEGEPT